MPYGVVLEGGVATFGRAVYISRDGLHYSRAADPRLDSALGSPVRAVLSAPRTRTPTGGARPRPSARSSLAGKGGTYLRAEGGGCPLMRIVPPSIRLVCDVEEPIPRDDAAGLDWRADPHHTLDKSGAVLEISRDRAATGVPS